MAKRKQDQSVVKPLFWEIHEAVPVPEGVDLEGLLSLYRISYGCLQFLRARKAKPEWTDEDKYVKTVIREAERRWKKNRNPYDVVRLLDNFPRLLEPTVISGFPWVLEALCMIFMNRKYELFAVLDAALNAGGAHKSDVNIRTFREYYFVFEVLKRAAVQAWIRQGHPVLTKLIDDDDVQGVKNYLYEHKRIRPPKTILRGLWNKAKDHVCQYEKISEETFKLRIKRAKKEPAVKVLIRTTDLLGENDAFVILPDDIDRERLS